jgi:hypothetical protein
MYCTLSCYCSDNVQVSVEFENCDRTAITKAAVAYSTVHSSTVVLNTVLSYISLHKSALAIVMTACAIKLLAEAARSLITAIYTAVCYCQISLSA